MRRSEERREEEEEKLVCACVRGRGVHGRVLCLCCVLCGVKCTLFVLRLRGTLSCDCVFRVGNVEHEVGRGVSDERCSTLIRETDVASRPARFSPTTAGVGNMGFSWDPEDVMSTIMHTSQPQEVHCDVLSTKLLCFKTPARAISSEKALRWH